MAALLRLDISESVVNLSRDDWMVIERALQDRIEVLKATANFGPGSLRFHEVQTCGRLRTLINETQIKW